MCSAQLLAELGGILGGDSGRLSTAASVCTAHGKDESYHAAIAPDAVVFPTSTANVAQVTCFRLANAALGEQADRQFGNWWQPNCHYTVRRQHFCDITRLHCTTLDAQTCPYPHSCQ